MGHFGLQSLQQRANMCGGRFTLKTAIGAGCCVELEVPVANTRRRLKLKLGSRMRQAGNFTDQPLREFRFKECEVGKDHACTESDHA